MDIVLLTGANSEPAYAIARRLIGLGARVYGFAHRFPEQTFEHREFVRVAVNPADPAAMRDEVAKIVAREGAVNMVVLAGHHPVDDSFEAAHPADVTLALNAGLVAPVAAVREAVPGLIRRRGLVVALTRPVFGPGAALGGVVEAGLASFCDGLFSELRDTGVRVCHFRIQENPGPVDPASRYTNAPQSRVNPEIVADAVEAVARLRENNALTRVVLRPQATREEPRIPVTAEPRLAALQQVQLPVTRNYPPAEEKIFTPEYRRPDYAPPPEDKEEEYEDEGDDAVDPELAYLIKPRHRDRFVRDTHEEPRAEEGAPSPEDSETPEASRPANREPQRPAKQYHDPYAPQQQRPPKPPKHGALRIRSPHMGDEPGDFRQQRQPQQPSQQPPKQRPFDQMPRPKDWQGPRLPQNYLKDGKPSGNPAPQAQPSKRGPDLHPKYRAEQEARERAEAAAKESAEVVSESPAAVEPVAPKAPVAVPVIVPVESGRDAESEKPRAGRSEAVTLNFAPKKEIAPEPVAEVSAAPESGADSDEAPAAEKPKRKAAAKKPAKAKEESDAVSDDAKSAKARKKKAAKDESE